MRSITKLDVRHALWLLNNATGKKIDADGVGSYQLRGYGSGEVGLYVQINEAGGIRRLVPQTAAKTKREQYVLLNAYRAGIQDATEVRSERQD